MAAADTLFGARKGPESPAENAAAVSPHNTDELPFMTRGLYIGTGGDVTVTFVSTGTAILFKAVPTGTILPVRVKIVKATGTTATDIVALY